MSFVTCLRLSDHKVLHNIASSSSFFRFRSDFLAFFARISNFKFLELKEFNKTIIYPTRAHGIIVNYLVKFSAKYKGRSRNLAFLFRL